jgi:hypothetical protein
MAQRRRRLKHANDGNKKKNSGKEKHDSLLPTSIEAGAGARSEINA